MGPKQTNIIIRACVVLAMALVMSSNSHSRDTYETESIDSDSPDSYSLENKNFEDDSDAPILEMHGNLRKSMAYFVWMLQHVLMEDTRKSRICSPFSALLPLGKMALGSSSRRFEELRQAIGYRRSKIKKRFKRLMDRITHIEGKVVLMMASRMYVSTKNSLRSKFNSAAKAVFKSGCERIDFKDRYAAAEKMNRWVSAETKDMIRKVVDPIDIPPSTSLLLINAIYFRVSKSQTLPSLLETLADGAYERNDYNRNRTDNIFNEQNYYGGIWKNQFVNVKTETFHGDHRTEVQMMSTWGHFNYFKSPYLKAQLVEIPYASNDVSLILILPFKPDGLQDLLQIMSRMPEGLNDYLRQMKSTDLKLSIPKFRICSDIDLVDIYKKVGLKEILDPDNKVLTKIVRHSTVYVTKSYHTAMFDVDQHGSDGGVVNTAFFGKPKKEKEEPHEVKANHPFLFFVVAKAEQLFAGTFVG